MVIQKRHAMRKSDFKQFIEELKKIIGEEAEKLFSRNPEIIKTEFGELYAEDKEILAFKIDDQLLPTLKALHKEIVHLPIVVVDMGAVPFVTNGADIMAPGITDISNDLLKNDFITIVDENFRKPLAIGKLLFDGGIIKEMKKGKAIKNLHYVNDEIWSIKI